MGLQAAFGIFLILFILIGSLAIPVAVIAFLPGKRSMFLVASGFVFLSLWYTQQINDNVQHEDLLNLSSIIYGNIFIATQFAVIVKTIHLASQGKLGRKYWSFWDALVVIAVICPIWGNFALGSSRLCFKENKVLSKEELFERSIVGKDWYKLSKPQKAKKLEAEIKKWNIDYYAVSEASPSVFGSMRIYLELYYREKRAEEKGSRSYTSRERLLNSCGSWIGTGHSEGHSEEAITRNKEKGYIESVEKFLPPTDQD